MLKYVLLIASCGLADSRFIADTLPVFTASSATVTVPDNLCCINFSIAGPGFTISGAQDAFEFPVDILPGSPLSSAQLNTFPLNGVNPFGPIPSVAGTIVIDNVSQPVIYIGLLGPRPVLSATDAIVPATPNPTLTVPATLSGTFQACPLVLFNGSFGTCPSQTIVPIADISINLTGQMAFSFSGPNSCGPGCPVPVGSDTTESRRVRAEAV